MSDPRFRLSFFWNPSGYGKLFIKECYRFSATASVGRPSYRLNSRNEVTTVSSLLQMTMGEFIAVNVMAAKPHNELRSSIGAAIELSKRTLTALVRHPTL